MVETVEENLLNAVIFTEKNLESIEVIGEIYTSDDEIEIVSRNDRMI